MLRIKILTKVPAKIKMQLTILVLQQRLHHSKINILPRFLLKIKASTDYLLDKFNKKLVITRLKWKLIKLCTR